jgi:sensor domain CHASE-containing protein
LKSARDLAAVAIDVERRRRAASVAAARKYGGLAANPSKLSAARLLTGFDSSTVASVHSCI